MQARMFSLATAPSTFVGAYRNNQAILWPGLFLSRQRQCCGWAAPASPLNSWAVVVLEVVETLQRINADFSKRAVVHAAQVPWVASPTPGVERRMLDRIGDEVARATSIVRYAPGSAFPAHTHGGGEEYLVLEGTFQDEKGDHPVGTYVRNPPGSRHTPGSQPGCTLLVKLWQFDPGDRQSVRVATAGLQARKDTRSPGVGVIELYEDDYERVRIEHWMPGLVMDLTAGDGLELLLLEGGFIGAGASFLPWSWLRLPSGDGMQVRVGSAGVRVWLKQGVQPSSLRLPLST